MSRYLDTTDIYIAGWSYRPTLPCVPICSCVCLHLLHTHFTWRMCAGEYKCSAVPLSKIPIFAHPVKSKPTNPPRLREKCKLVGTSESLWSIPYSKHGHPESSIKWHRTSSILLCGPALDFLQGVNIALVPGGPQTEHTVFQMKPPKLLSRGQSPLPCTWQLHSYSGHGRPSARRGYAPASCSLSCP